MKIKLDEKHQIVSDSRQYLLQEIKVVSTGEKKGETYEDTLGYYSKIENALKAYKELRIRNSEATSIDELLELIKLLDSKIDKLEISKGVR